MPFCSTTSVTCNALVFNKLCITFRLDTSGPDLACLAIVQLGLAAFECVLVSVNRQR